MTNQHPENSVFRILDAAINRVGEGLRVVEDFIRMDLGDAHLAAQLKILRHDLTDAVAPIDPVQRIAARDSVGDVGRSIETPTEYQRGGISPGDATPSPGSPQPTISGGMIQANLARAQQGLRTIEEFSKTIDPDIAKQIEQLRYRTYTLEKAVLTTIVSLQNLSGANLCVLIDGCGAAVDSTEDLERIAQQLIDAEVSLIQLRDKTLTDRELVIAGRAISQMTRGTNTRMIMNDRADLALATNADGVHLGQDDLSVSDARRIVGAAKMIGVSTHSIEQARQAVLDGANYIGVGPVFRSTTKEFDTHVGLELVRQVANEVQLPAFAIGGISLDNLGDVRAAGLDRVAVSASIANSNRPMEAARQFKQALHPLTR